MANDAFQQFLNSIAASSGPQAPIFKAGAGVAPVRKTGDLDIAKMILEGANAAHTISIKYPEKPYNMGGTPATVKPHKKGPSWLSRTIDVLSRPLYGAWEGAKRSGGLSMDLTPTSIVNLGKDIIGGDLTGEHVKGAVTGNISGYAGKSKTLPSKILEEQGSLPENKWGKFAVGLGADILGDPLTWVGPGAVKAAGRGIKGLKTGKTTAQAGEKTVIPSLLPSDIKVAGMKAGQNLAAKMPGLSQEVMKAGVNIPTPGKFSTPFSGSLKTAQTWLDDLAKGSKEAEAAVLPPKTPKLPKLDANLTNKSMTLASSLANTTKKAFNPSLQVQLFKKISKDASLTGAKNTGPIALAMLKQAEAHLDEIGKATEFWDGTKVPLSEVLDELGSKFKPHHLEELAKKNKNLSPELFEAIEKVKARNTLHDSATASVAADQATSTMAAADNALSPAGAAQVMKDFEKDAANVLKGSGAGSASVKGTKDLIQGIVNSYAGAPQAAVRKHASAFERASSRSVRGVGNLNPARSAVTNAVNMSLDVPVRRVQAGKTLSDNAVIHGVMSRVATQWGQKDVRPFALDAVTSARASTEARAAADRPFFHGVSNEDRYTAFKAAQQRIPGAIITDPKVLDLTNHLRKTMESLFSSSGLKAAAEKANTVALRSGMVMEDINNMLAHYGSSVRFTDGPVMDDLGRALDYSGGTKWLNSWESWAFKGKGSDVAKEIQVVQNAVEQLTREYAFVDDMAARFGYSVKKPGFSAVKHTRLDGVYFPKEIAPQITKALETMHDFYRPKSPIMKAIRETTSIWKSLVTVINPNHHVTNNIGDIFLGWQAGVNNPNVYRKSAQVLKAMAPEFKNAERINELVGAGAIPKAMAANKGKVVTTTKNGVKLTNEQLYIAAHQKGLLQDTHAVEDLMDAPLSMKLSSGKWNPIHWGAKTSEISSQWTRMAHFIDAVQKSKLKDIDEVFTQAAHEVRKWHPDGMDLTKAEQKFRQFVPFYSWMRKSTPLIFEGAILRPGKIPAIQKTAFHVQQDIRGEDASLTDPFNTGSGLWPGWMVTPYTSGSTVTPRLPFTDLASTFESQGPMAGIKGQVTPLIQIPYEGLTDTQFETGKPIYDKGKWAKQQTPVVSKYMSLSGNGEDFQPAKFAQWLTGAQVTQPYNPNSPWEIQKAKTAKSAQNKEIRKWASEKGLTDRKGNPISSNSKIPDWMRSLYNQEQGG